MKWIFQDAFGGICYIAKLFSHFLSKGSLTKDGQYREITKAKLSNDSKSVLLYSFDVTAPAWTGNIWFHVNKRGKVPFSAVLSDLSSDGNNLVPSNKVKDGKYWFVLLLTTVIENQQNPIK